MPYDCSNVMHAHFVSHGITAISSVNRFNWNKPEQEHKYKLPVVLYGCEAWSLTGRRRT
jgi:hypothetical protein